MVMDALAMRLLLGAGHGGDSDEDSEYVEGDGPHDDTQTLRIVSIFVILAAGLLGGIPPLFIKVFRDPDSLVSKLVRGFAAGVILALALVHIIPEAVEEMDGLGDINYPLGGTTVLFGVALMIFLEHMAHIMHGSSSAHASVHAVRSAHGTAGEATSPKPVTAQGAQDCAVVQIDGCTAVPPAAVAENPSMKRLQVEGPEDVGGIPGHSHSCVSRGSASNLVTAVAVEAVGSLRLKIVAYLFELGCIFHSFIIGLSLGVNQTDLTEVRSLLIALAFHQWLEGISLASVVIRGGFSVWKGILMIATYSLTCPVGIAVGMGIASTYDPETDTARGVQGTFNGVSGGMLLYISLVQLVAEDMGRMVPGRDRAMSRIGAFAALFGGAASMCLLAVWA